MASRQYLPLIESYFSLFSAGEMEAFRALFHEKAVIIHVGDGTVYDVLGRDEFVTQQTPEPQDKGKRNEKMSSFTVEEGEVVTVVSVKYLMEADGESTTGVDRFTLMPDHEGIWKIISLLWYADKSPINGPLVKKQ